MRNISGQRFGRLVAKSLDHSIDHRRFWLCACDCGNLAVVRQDQLTTGKTTSCGCYMRERRLENLKKQTTKEHPQSYVCNRVDGRHKKWNPLIHEYPRLYRIWQSMKSRCYYEKNKCYSIYGGRGISICKEWRNSFNTFAIWSLSNGYADNLSIDRIDVNGNYEPDNCRWATNAEQQRNKRKNPLRIA